MDISKLISRFKLDCSVNTRKFYHGHEYVDLGLPSGTLWATMNVGAEKETDYGNYYMCGNGSNTYNSSDTIYMSDEEQLESSLDTATKVWGGKWYMPTIEQMEELINKTMYRWAHNYKNSGINGGLFTSKTNGKSVFLPACGFCSNGERIHVESYSYYWSSSLSGSSKAYYLAFYGSGYLVSSYFRYFGFPVRPVLKLE